MKRDMDLIRELLLHIEADDGYDGSGYGPVKAKELGRPANVVLYHMSLLADAKFVSVVNWLAHGEPLIRGLTWEGHEFLDDTRDPEIWRKTKARAKAVTNVGARLLWEIAKAELKAKLGLP
jgi:hypothetical protein